MQIWLTTKQIFKFVMFLLIQWQTIDNFFRYIAVKINHEKQKTSARAGKIIEMALYRYPRTQSQKHNIAQSSRPMPNDGQFLPVHLHEKQKTSARSGKIIEMALHPSRTTPQYASINY